MRSNDDDRRQWRKQGGVVGAAASKTQVPLKARSGCWVPQPDKRRAFPIIPLLLLVHLLQDLCDLGRGVALLPQGRGDGYIAFALTAQQGKQSAQWAVA